MTLPISSREFFTEMVPCPICGSSDFVPLSNVERNHLKMHTVGCTRCSLVMTNPQPTSQRLERFYREEYRFYYQNVSSPSVEYIQRCRKDERAKQTVRFFREHDLLKRDWVVLDVGASEGSLLKECKSQEPTLRAIAVEPGTAFREFCADFVGCEAHASVEAFLATHQKVDFVIVNHVLEHAKNPIGLLKMLRGCIRAQGSIYVDVPCVTDYTDPSMLHVAHMYHFRGATLTRALELAGFSVALVERHSPIMHPPSIRAIARLSHSQSIWQPNDIDDGWDRLRKIDRWGALWLGYRSILNVTRNAGREIRRALQSAPRQSKSRAKPK